MKTKNLLLCLIFLSFFSFAQTPQYKGIIWVTNKNSTTLPVEGILTGNEELNQLFSKYHVTDYSFRFLYLDVPEDSMYQISMDSEFVFEEEIFYQELSASNIFKAVCRPYCPYTGQTSIAFMSDDHSLRPCTPITSCNEAFNEILNKFSIQGYFELIAQAMLPDIGFWIYIPFNEFDDLYLALRNSDFNIRDLMGECFSVGVLDSINDDWSSGINISPNPVNDLLFINGVVPKSVSIYDLQGRVLFTTTQNTNNLNLANLAKGIYFLQIISDSDKKCTKKIIKN